jgi:hypothetical protein
MIKDNEDETALARDNVIVAIFKERFDHFVVAYDIIASK